MPELKENNLYFKVGGEKRTVKTWALPVEFGAVTTLLVNSEADAYRAAYCYRYSKVRIGKGVALGWFVEVEAPCRKN